MTLANRVNQRATAILIKMQSGRGVLVTPSPSTDGLPLIGTPPLLTPDYLEKNDQKVTTGRMGNAGGKPAPAGKYGKFTIALQPKGLGVAPTAFTRPEIDALMRISKHASAFNAAATFPGGVTGAAAWDYTDSDTVDEVATVYFYSPGRLTILADCVGTRKGNLDSNKPGAEAFEVSGRIVSVAQASAPSITISPVVPPVWNGNTASFGALASDSSSNGIAFLSAEIDEKITVNALPSGGKTDDSGTPNLSGIAGFDITDRAPSLKVVMVQPPLSVYNPIADADDPNAAPARKFTAALGNMASPGNRVFYQTGSMIPGVPGENNINGTMTWEITGDILDGTEPVGQRHTLLRIG